MKRAVPRLVAAASAPTRLQPARHLFGFPSPVTSLEKSHRERRLLQYPPALVYHVVSTVEEYNKFVPWCIDSRVFKRTDNFMEAELAVGFQMFAERYTSRVTLDPGKRVESIAQATQLFHFLKNEWLFDPGPTLDSCWVTFRVDFAFRSLLYAQAANLFFEEVVAKMVGAYEGRCRDLHEGRAVSNVPFALPMPSATAIAQAAKAAAVGAAAGRRGPPAAGARAVPPAAPMEPSVATATRAPLEVASLGATATAAAVRPVIVSRPAALPIGAPVVRGTVAGVQRPAAGGASAAAAVADKLRTPSPATRSAIAAAGGTVPSSASAGAGSRLQAGTPSGLARAAGTAGAGLRPPTAASRSAAAIMMQAQQLRRPLPAPPKILQAPTRVAASANGGHHPRLHQHVVIVQEHPEPPPEPRTHVRPLDSSLW